MGDLIARFREHLWAVKPKNDQSCGGTEGTDSANVPRPGKKFPAVAAGARLRAREPTQQRRKGSRTVEEPGEAGSFDGNGRRNPSYRKPYEVKGSE
ncbi:hypothetical protein Bca52824_087068 [Brassica carinata]|uniref:Uncharacterized protein n=1 Tax=Brassica carinata TaxID=52824 RepID=A0A8X7TMF6_BRACI|nr:hypothetical protein Bca52824_087068 [Brassica carinata]